MTRLDETWSLSYVGTVGQIRKRWLFGGRGRGRGRVREEGVGRKYIFGENTKRGKGVILKTLHSPSISFLDREDCKRKQDTVLYSCVANSTRLTAQQKNEVSSVKRFFLNKNKNRTEASKTNRYRLT